MYLWIYTLNKGEMTIKHLHTANIWDMIYKINDIVDWINKCEENITEFKTGSSVQDVLKKYDKPTNIPTKPVPPIGGFSSNAKNKR